MMWQGSVTSEDTRGNVTLDKGRYPVLLFWPRPNTRNFGDSVRPLPDETPIWQNPKPILPAKPNYSLPAKPGSSRRGREFAPRGSLPPLPNRRAGSGSSLPPKFPTTTPAKPTSARSAVSMPGAGFGMCTCRSFCRPALNSWNVALHCRESLESSQALYSFPGRML